jgi:hypothetical protein
VQPNADRYRALARSSPWRWQTLRFTTRWIDDDDAPAVRGWVRRPGYLRVEALDGELLAAERGEPSRAFLTAVGTAPAPVVAVGSAADPVDAAASTAGVDDALRIGPDGLVLGRPFGLDRADDPMYGSYHWVAMLDPVEFADSRDDDAEDPPVVVDAVHEVDHHGRPAWEALLRPRASYDPRCTCCALLLSAESEARGADEGAPTVRDSDPEFRYADAHRVRLDVGTGVCVLTEQVGGSRSGQGHEVVIEAVDEEMGDDLFRRPRRHWLRR